MMAVPGLDIKMSIDPARARLWHRGLAGELRRRGHRVSIELRPGGARPPRAIGLILAIERLAHRQPPFAPGAEWPSSDLRAISQFTGGADLEIDLTGHSRAAGSADGRTLRPVYGDSLVEEAVVADLLAGRIPDIGVSDSTAPQFPLMMRPAVEDSLHLSRALDNLGTRLSTILARATDIAARGGRSMGADAVALRDATAWTAGGSFSAVSRKAVQFLNRLLRKGPHWYVGWRFAEADRLTETLQIPSGGWQVLPDDGKRFYADPFVVRRDGRLWMFVEEFPYATEKGILSVVEIGPGGPIDTPRPVLETSTHLSYPFVFERDGAIWMVPESSSAKTVDLYRAIDFPGTWRHEATLLSGIQVSDATIVEHGGRLWMFGTVSAEGSSSWDALHLWSAPSLTGPWREHDANPVLIDSLGARPAGAFYKKGGDLWRPAQDCTTGYGVGLALCRVTKLDDEGFAQRIERVIRPGGQDWPGIGLHSLNWAGGLEVVDGCRDRKR